MNRKWNNRSQSDSILIEDLKNTIKIINPSVCVIYITILCLSCCIFLWLFFARIDTSDLISVNVNNGVIKTNYELLENADIKYISIEDTEVSIKNINKYSNETFIETTNEKLNGEYLMELCLSNVSIYDYLTKK